MTDDPIAKDERDTVIARHEELWAEYLRAMDEEALPYEEEVAIQDELEELLGAYFDRLPRMPLSRCPICGDLFRHSFDPWGADGYWWQEGASKRTHEPDPCPHFGVLQGAVHLNGENPLGGEREEAFIGPAAPFVIPRILKQPSVVAVISSIPMANGYLAFPIVYFTGEPLPPGSFTQQWTRGSYSWVDVRGNPAWRVDTDPWDFELEPWVRDGKVLWISGGDPEMRIRSHRDGPCPYLGQPGTREQQFLQGGEMWTKAPPRGQGIDPFAE